MIKFIDWVILLLEQQTYIFDKTTIQVAQGLTLICITYLIVLLSETRFQNIENESNLNVLLFFLYCVGAAIFFSLLLYLIYLSNVIGVALLSNPVVILVVKTRIVFFLYSNILMLLFTTLVYREAKVNKSALMTLEETKYQRRAGALLRKRLWWHNHSSFIYAVTLIVFAVFSIIGWLIKFKIVDGSIVNSPFLGILSLTYTAFLMGTLLQRAYLCLIFAVREVKQELNVEKKAQQKLWGTK